MNLQDFTQKPTSAARAKIFESYFDDSIDVNDLSRRDAEALASRVQRIIAEARRRDDFYISETKPAYIKAVMLEQLLSQHLSELAGSSPTSPQQLGAASPVSIDPKKPFASQQKPQAGDIQAMANNVKGPAATTARKIAQQARAKGGDKNTQIQAAIALNAMAGADGSGMAESSITGKNKPMNKEYSINYVQENDEWCVVDAVGNHVESFIDKHEAAKKARELNRGSSSAPASHRHVNYRSGVEESSRKMKRPVREGKVKEMAIDLDELSPAKFKAKYKMTKAECRAASTASAPKKKTAVKENKLANVKTRKLVEYITKHRGVNHPAVRMVESELKRRRNIVESARKRRLNESEVQQAQVVLAAQDMVDSVQKMVESASTAQFKDLPALVSQIRIDQGPDQSVQFNQAATAAFGGLIQALQSAKDQLENAIGIVTGQGGGQVAMPPELDGDSAELPPDDAMSDFEDTPDVDLEAETDDITGLGRDRR